ncbi:MAG TPA: hypothetical protein VE569_01805 [Acidimicrobiia bacterium]|jgi:hypothetical protein|nr:hypothetical protein [Acidimicrobiia bacterium]
MTAGGEATGVAQTTSSDDENAESVDVDFEIADRQVVRRASLQLHASDTRRPAHDGIVSPAPTAGGFVADATVHPASGEDAFTAAKS